MTKGKNIEEHLACARMAVRKKTPYLTSLVNSPVLYESHDVPTLGITPGMVIYYNPDFLMSLEVEEVAFALLHEVNHPLRKHHERVDKRDRELWNIAGDLAINTDLRDCGWPVPAIAHMPDKHGFNEGLTSEEYYELLLQKQKQQKQQKVDKKGDGPPKPDKGGGSSGEGSSPPPAPNCGGGAGNANHELEARIDQEMGRSSADQERIKKRLTVDVERHIAQNGRGSVPGSFAEWARSLGKPPTVSWERELRHITAGMIGKLESGGHDYSMSRISKRSFVRRIMRPGLVSFVPEGAVILDTSGSVRLSQAQALLQEVSGILRALGVPDIWFLQADTRVACAPIRVRVRDLKEMKLHGRGGTAFGPALEAVRSLRPRPSFVIYGTDGDGSMPEHQPAGLQVIWAMLPGSYRKDMPWGKVVQIR